MCQYKIQFANPMFIKKQVDSQEEYDNSIHSYKHFARKLHFASVYPEKHCFENAYIEHLWDSHISKV